MASASTGHVAPPPRDILPAIGVMVLNAKDLPFAFEAALPSAHPPRTATDHVCEDGFRSATVEPICSAHCDFILGKCSPRFASPTSV
jgi:hypothetical protein